MHDYKEAQQYCLSFGLILSLEVSSKDSWHKPCFFQW